MRRSQSFLSKELWLVLMGWKNVQSNLAISVQSTGRDSPPKATNPLKRVIALGHLLRKIGENPALRDSAVKVCILFSVM